MDASSALSDLSDYDVISNSEHRSIESSIADLDHIPAQVPSEPAISQAARESFFTASLSAKAIQAYVRKALGLGVDTNADEENSCMSNGAQNKTMRIYIDGSFDVFNAG